MKFKLGFAAMALACLLLGNQAFSTTLYSEDFSVDPTASWTVNDGGTTDVLADFFYDYSAIGVPSAPNGSGTSGLKMTANNTTGVFGGFSTSPNGQNFTGDYQVKFDLWQNYVGPVGPGGSGTTQLSTMGIGTAGNVAVWPGSSNKESVMFGVTLDGGSSVDYRVYSSDFDTGHPEGDPVFSAPGGARNGNNAYYTTAFPGGETAPGDQVTLFPGQTGSASPGEISFKWRSVTIDVVGGNATWSVDGTSLASIDLGGLTLGGGNILFGHSDTNNSSSSDPNDSMLNVTLIDNIVVTRIPEPSALTLLCLGTVGMGLVRKRR